MANVEVDALVAPVESQLGSREGFLRRFVRWAVTQTDGPVEYHVLSALVLLSTAAQPMAKIQFGTSTQPVNIFGLQVGGSGRDRKSASQGLAASLLRDACTGSGARKLVGPRVGSLPALMDAIQEQPYLCVFESEASTILAQTNSKTGYLADLKPGITDLYDGYAMSNRTRKKPISVEHFRLSLLWAISLPYLQDFSEPSDFTGGFWSRWLFALGRRDRFMVMPDDSSEAKIERQGLVDMLKNFISYAPSGLFVFSPEAMFHYSDWARRLDAMSQRVHENQMGLYNRADALTRKVSALLAMDRLVFREGYRHSDIDSIGADNYFTIETDDLFTAAHIVSAHLECAGHIVSSVAHSESARLKAKVLTAIPKTKAVPLGHITQATGLLRKKAMEALETLILERRVMCMMGPGSTGNVYIQTAINEVHGDAVGGVSPLPSLPTAPGRSDYQTLDLGGPIALPGGILPTQPPPDMVIIASNQNIVPEGSADPAAQEAEEVPSEAPVGDDPLDPWSAPSYSELEYTPWEP